MNYKKIIATQIDHIDFKDVNIIDRLMFTKYNVSTTQLMEIAGFQVSQHISRMKNIHSILIVCGKGNNGGDGLVAARYLHAKGFNIELYLTHSVKELNIYSKKQLKILKTFPIKVHKDFPMKKTFDLTVDAILGSGSKNTLREDIKTIVYKINNTKKKCLSIDTPTGIKTNTIVNADETITFVLPKKIFLKNHHHCGTIFLADIGIPLLLLAKKTKQNLYKENTFYQLEYK